MKRYSAGFLTVCLLISLLVGCGGESPAQSDDTTTAAPETTQSVEDILGFPKEDNGGRTFTVLSTTSKQYEYDAEEATGDVVSDAVYEKNTAVEDYFGINFEFLYEDGGWNNRGTYNNLIISDVMSGTGTYDLVSAVTVCTISAASEGIFFEGKSLPYCDFSKPWWIADMYDRFSISGKLFGFIGDGCLSLYKDMTVVYFNKRIWDEYKQPNPYELVRNNEWTLDKMIELTSGMANDLNGDGTYDAENDQLAYLAEQVPNGTFQTSLELKVVQIGKDGTPEYLGLSERFITAYEKMLNFHKGPGVMTMTTIDDASYRSMKTFNNGNVATMVNFIYSTEHLRDMKDDYGILPMPKYDQNQEKYISQLGTSTAMYFVPLTTKDVALTSKVMEAFCYYTGEMVVPKYYEVALKEKYARDEDIAEMLDIIRAGAAFDFLYVYGAGCLSKAPNSYFRFVNTNTTDVASAFASNESAFVSSLEKLIETYAEIDG